jgi:hypothetical protein
MLGVFCPELLGHRGLRAPSAKIQFTHFKYLSHQPQASSYKLQASSRKLQAASIKLQVPKFFVNRFKRQAASFKPQATSGELLDAGAFIKFFIFVQVGRN